MDERVAMSRLREGADQANARGGRRSRQPQRPGRSLLPRRSPNSAARKPVAAATNAVAVAGRRGGPVGRMQTQLATAINQDADWKEF